MEPPAKLPGASRNELYYDGSGERLRQILSKAWDNGFVYIARAFTQQARFFAAVAEAASGLPHAIVSVTPSLGTDWNGEAAVFFQVVLAAGSSRGQLLNLTKQVSWAIVQQVQPLEEWGVLPYFDFRTQSEQAEIKEPTWA
ncbi:MAG: hypothetical protein ACLQU1_21865 [Bryobacteraceae bacterium]